MPDDYDAMLSELEQEAEDRAPGVLEALEAYSKGARSEPQSWRPLNVGVGRFATGTSDSPSSS